MFGTATIKLVLVLIVVVLLYFLVNRWINNSLDANSPTLDVAKAVGLQDYITTKDNIVTACTTERERRMFDHQRSLVNRELLKNISFRAKLRVTGQENGGLLGILRAITKPKNQRVVPPPVLIENPTPSTDAIKTKKKPSFEMGLRAKKLHDIQEEEENTDQGFVDRGSSSCSNGEEGELERYYGAFEINGEEEDDDDANRDSDEVEEEEEDENEVSSTHRRELKTKRPKLGARVRRRRRRRSRKNFHPFRGHAMHGTAGSHIYHHYYYRADRPEKLRRRDECADISRQHHPGPPPPIHQPMQRHTLPPPPPAIEAPPAETIGLIPAALPIDVGQQTYASSVRASSTSTTSSDQHPVFQIGEHEGGNALLHCNSIPAPPILQHQDGLPRAIPV